MTTDLDALMREPDDFEWRLFAIEKALHLIEDCRAVDGRLIRDLTAALAEDDEEYGPQTRKVKPVDLSGTIADVFKFLHDMHAAYIVEREHARAARSLLARKFLTRRKEDSVSGGQTG